MGRPTGHSGCWPLSPRLGGPQGGLGAIKAVDRRRREISVLQPPSLGLPRPPACGTQEPRREE